MNLFLILIVPLVHTVLSTSIPCVPLNSIYCSNCITRLGSNATYIYENITEPSTAYINADSSIGSTVSSLGECNKICAYTRYCVGILHIDNSCIVYTGTGSGTVYSLLPVRIGYNITFMCQNYFTAYNIEISPIGKSDTYTIVEIKSECGSDTSICEYINITIQGNQQQEYQILPMVNIVGSNVVYKSVLYESSIGETGVIIASLSPLLLLFLIVIYTNVRYLTDIFTGKDRRWRTFH